MSLYYNGEFTRRVFFDIETIPDVNALRQLRIIPDDVADSDIPSYLKNERNIDFLPCHLHKVVAISMVARQLNEQQQELKLSVGTTKPKLNPNHQNDDLEAGIIRAFFEFIGKTPTQLITWNGSGFDLPTLVQRATILGVNHHAIWDTSNKYNNYLSRFHTKHLDLMDVLGLRAGKNAKLDEIAKMSGFAGKMNVDGSDVFPLYLDGKQYEINTYCEMDACNTYLMWLRWLLVSEHPDVIAVQYENEMRAFAQVLYNKYNQDGKEEWLEFIQQSPNVKYFINI